MKKIHSVKLLKRIAKVGRITAELLFPLRCPVCDKPVRLPGKGICPECRPKLILIQNPKCGKCGKSLRNNTREYCRDCRSVKHSFDRGTALFTYASCNRTIYRMKYSGRREYAACLGTMMAEKMGRQIRQWKPDALIPVPLHAARQKARGYNQAELLAENIGKELGIPILSNYVVRTRNTLPQKAAPAGLRRNNLKSSFKIVQNDVKLNTIVIIDDIYTTGSTMDTVAEECRKAGVKKVYFAVLAAGEDPDPHE